MLHALLVHDCVTERAIITDVFTEQHIQISAESRLEAALLWFEHGGEADLCVIDASLAEEAVALCRAIREAAVRKDLYIILLLDLEGRGQLESLYEAGMNDYLLRPFAAAELKQKLDMLLQLKRFEAGLVETELAMLRAKIKPHFLFNAIGTIIFISKRNAEEARTLLRSLSEFLRGSFDFENKADVVSFKVELALVNAYLNLEKARFGSRLHVNYNLKATQFYLPPFILQTLVENAIRHGLTARLIGGTIDIGTLLVPAGVRVTIKDDGVGIREEELERFAQVKQHSEYRRMAARGQRQGMGLANTNERLLRHFGTGLQIRRRKSGGTTVSFLIPAQGGLVNAERCGGG
ncbi:hypothetical protein BBD42_02400 [Paenibacillus sp. BIHB 4019]|uniref:Histidine kinase domain-containing protein n=1 Tax=Paenibacillus sp. BIHB 4019 TaxID=1870819 RepID=A0A1B2DCJ9_9BACL|nr:histidine kinase [Paenibacillus sp. BIHB 4019]ANY65444.1 hypothetical protein BBD42_02400 [Paenibacillus sp. BIHB 4019]